jgi:hypothetical protein
VVQTEAPESDPPPAPARSTFARWSVPVVGALVAIVLLVVIISSIQGEDESEDGTPTTAEPAEDDAPLAAVDQVCAEQLPSLFTPIQQVAALGSRAAATTDQAELAAIADQAEAESRPLLQRIEDLGAQVSAASVPPEATVQRDEIANALSEITFGIGSFTNRSIEVLRAGDPAAIQAYEAEAQTSVLALIGLVQQLNAAAGEQAPSCTVEIPEVVAEQDLPPGGAQG